MRILHVADLHYTLPQLDWVVARAPEFDLVALAGDHLDVSSTVPLGAQAIVALEYIARLAKATTVVVSSGNHDLTGPDANGEQAALWIAAARDAGATTDWDAVEVGSALVTVCPWWDGPLGRTAVAEQLAAGAQRARRPWIWLYHWPPDGSPTCWTGQRHYGDADVTGWIAEHQPDVVLTGHVHQPPFREDGAWADRLGDSWVFNPGRQPGPVPAHVIVDLDDGVAEWWSLAGAETQRLDEAPVRPRPSSF